MRGDQKKAAQFLFQHADATDKQRQAFDGVKKMVAEKFCACVEMTEAVRAKTTTAGQRKAWRANVKAQWRTVVKEEAPPGSKVYTNDVNGHYTLSVGPFGPRHFSWTMRGTEAAALMSLKWLWDKYLVLVPTEVLPPQLDFTGVEY